MSKTPRTSLAAVLAIALSSPSVALASDLSALKASDFYHAAYFKDAQEHPAIQKLKSDDAKLAAVAKDLKIKPKDLTAAIQKMEAAGGDVESITKAVEAAVKAAAESTRIKGRLLDVLVNAEEPKHVVLYVRWQSSGSRDVVKEASTIAAIVSAETPLVSTLSLAAISPKASRDSKDAVWSGKISSESMAKIQKSRIDDYGDRLYKGLFEGVEAQPSF
ncbi:hypothetical protein L6R52_42080 [Myxococcota bacterium]|nr:hypothetical protein [Myxococcota bacterium]